MRKFMCEDFLLMTETAKTLYHDYAKDMPIYDYHCHLDPKEIYENKKYKNITEIWLGGDHYKWRAMRSNGVSEKYITGDGDDKEKFIKWCETLEKLFGNPLFHWTQLELKKFFNIDKILSVETSDEIWEETNRLLQTNEFTSRELISRSNVREICTTDDPTDSLEYHEKLKDDDSFKTIVRPTFRPDNVIKIEKDNFIPWLKKLEKVVNFEIINMTDLKKALSLRVDFFHSVNCRLSDHSLEPVVFEKFYEAEIDEIFKKRLNLVSLSELEEKKYKTAIMIFLGREYNRKNWVMQLHTGCLRNNSERMLGKIGVDTGFDSIDDRVYIRELSQLLNSLDVTNELPKTIIYNLNPRENEAIMSLIGCFQSEGVSGKIQFGSAWWFLDQKDGMEKQMISLASNGILSNFIGMLTDSRSFLSYTRHEYFRRILCNILGNWVENGEIPNQIDKIGTIVKDICFNNIDKYISK